MLIHTRCPIDNTDDADEEVYPANFEFTDLNSLVFSARRNPDRIHYRMVKNTKTGCLRADPILDDSTLQALYAQSKVTDLETWHRAAETYSHYLEQYALPHLPDRRGLLELGCGHGPFLTLMRDLAFDRLAGIEPSKNAISKAPEEIQSNIHEGFLRSGLFLPDSISIVCGFQVLDHIAQPNTCLQLIREILMPGGIVFFICHDVGSPLARILGRRCPMIDIEHPVLYNRSTIAQLLQRNGFRVLEQFGVSNKYPLDYWAHLAPLPKVIKNPVARFLSATGIGRISLHLNAGNMGIVAKKL